MSENGRVARFGDEAFVWKRKFERAYGRMFALETAYARRLLRHNAGPGPEPCTCEECTWLRSLMDDRLAERLKSETERTVIVSTDFEGAARRQLDQLDEDERAAEQVIAEAVARRDDVKRERTALAAALATYERVRTKQSPAGGPKALPAPREHGQQNGRTFCLAWAKEHDGVIVRADAQAAALLAGLGANAVSSVLLLPDLFERVERGVYRLREAAA